MMYCIEAFNRTEVVVSEYSPTKLGVSEISFVKNSIRQVCLKKI